MKLANLSPSAARLLLAFLTTTGDEDWDVLITRAGIQSLKTYRKAKQQLQDAGLLHSRNGQTYSTISALSELP